MSVMLYGAGILAEIADAYARETGQSRVSACKLLAGWSFFNAAAFAKRYAHIPALGNRDAVTADEIFAALPDPTKPVSPDVRCRVSLMQYNLDESAPKAALTVCSVFAIALGVEVSS